MQNIVEIYRRSSRRHGIRSEIAKSKFCEELLGKKIMIVLAKRAIYIVRTKSLSIKKITKADVVNSDETVSYETTHEFSHIQSEKSLRLVIDTIFDLADAENRKRRF